MLSLNTNSYFPFCCFFLVPSKSSDLFHLFIESLFITHAECKLNEIGDLVYEKSDPNSALNNTWCASLTRRPSP